MSIVNSGVLVDLNMSVWTGKKQDRKVSAEVDINKQTRTKAGSYNKNLFAGTDKLEKVTSVASKIRNWHVTQTLPWSDNGTRLLPMGNFFEYKHQLAQFETEFNQAVQDFIADYSSLIAAAAFQIGALFNRDDYPTEDRLASKFSIRYSFNPVPLAGDFRVDTDAETQAELKEQYEKQYQQKVAESTRDLWDRLHEYLTTFADRLHKMDNPPEPDAPTGTDTQTEPKVRKVPFREAHINNGVELCELLTKLNVTGDPELEEARRDLERALLGVSVKEVRDSEGTRKEVKARVQDILGKFNW